MARVPPTVKLTAAPRSLEASRVTGVGDAAGLEVAEGEALGETAGERLINGKGLTVGESVGEGLALGDGVAEGVAPGVRTGAREGMGLAKGVILGVGIRLSKFPARTTIAMFESLS